MDPQTERTDLWLLIGEGSGGGGEIRVREKLVRMFGVLIWVMVT